MRLTLVVFVLSILVLIALIKLNLNALDWYKTYYTNIAYPKDIESGYVLDQFSVFKILLSLFQIFTIYLAYKIFKNNRSLGSKIILLSTVIIFILIWIPYYQFVLGDSVIDLNFQ